MIRWPRDALIFSARAGAYACYAAGYVEGDVHQTELLGAAPGPGGAELVTFRLVPTEGVAVGELAHRVQAERALAGLGCPSIAGIHEVFVTSDKLQPDATSSLETTLVVVIEELPGNVHVRDLRQRLFSRGEPPLGLALYITRAVMTAAAAQPPSAMRASGLRLRRNRENILLSWDGRVSVQPRANVFASDDPESDHVVSCARLIAELTNLESAPVAVKAVVATAMKGEPERPNLAWLSDRLDELVAEHPYGANDLAGLLANLFREDRDDDLAFREELAACSLDELNIPEIKRLPLEALASEVLRDLS